MAKAQACDFCQHFDFGATSESEPFAWIRKPSCAKGHKPRFFQPRGPMDQDWGWKRRCDEFQLSESVIVVKPK
jgi:hypothetical protein